ncbi:MAG: polyprenyl diphosphate synthase [Pseudonocardiaceae bacterium]
MTPETPARAPAAPTEVNTPAHVAVILDGNRRWAARHAVPTAQAYQLGARRAVELTTCCHLRGIRYLTLWALSQENLRRPPEQIGSLLEVIIAGLSDIAASHRWRIHHLGEPDLLPESIRCAISEIVRETSHDAPGTLNVAIAYNGRDDIASAVRSLILAGQTTHSAQRVACDGLSTLLGDHFATAGQPDPDLVIRTSGEYRLSGFMPWQTAYSELYFTRVDWPDFTTEQLDCALDSYRSRQRRHGC